MSKKIHPCPACSKDPECEVCEGDGLVTLETECLYAEFTAYQSDKGLTGR